LTVKLLGRRSLYGKRENEPEAEENNKFLYGFIAALSAVLIPLWGGIALTGYFVAPKTVWHQVTYGDFTFGVKAGILGVALYILIGSVFVRHTFCKYVCAAGLMQMLFGWVSPISLRLRLDTTRMGECTDCRKCEKACFMGVLPRKNKRDVSCVNCGACIDACNRELGGRGLFHYSIGDTSCLAPTENCILATKALPR
ncbi:MAG TPA: 4Fe-4S dicluster domain-containing protein, partial [Thermodesulfovibrionales bacterium]|nr:4Fe-4S dicluster domain-containing protein [Thermodesulfovibrionales bacterium]